PADSNRSDEISQRIQRRPVTGADLYLPAIQRAGVQHLPGVLWRLVRADRLPHFHVDFHAANSRCAGGACGLVLADLPVAAARSLPFALQSSPSRTWRTIADAVVARDGRERA